MLRKKYQDVLDLGEELGVRDGFVEEVDDKLKFGGVAQYQYDFDRLWDAIKAHDNWEKEIWAEIKVAPSDIYGIYEVRPGDSLSKISKLHCGDPMRYMEIFELNKDILTNPDVIKVGQKLKLPAKK